MATKIKFHIRQRCAAAILNVLESAAEGGVICRLKDADNNDIVRWLFPRLMAMNFDQPEAQLVFGMLNRQSCSKCRWRKGRSAFRHGSHQIGSAVRRLYHISSDPVTTTEHKRLARKKLLRWGFNADRPCSMLSGCNRLLLRLRGKDEVFPCLDYRDIMHGVKIFLHRIIVMETLNEIPLIRAAQRVMLQRLRLVLTRQTFRDRNGKAYRSQSRIFTDANMSAADKVAVLFLLPHVLGHKGEILPEVVREPMLTALAQAQLIIISTTGHRSYTVPELRVIFENGWKTLFGALERVYSQCFAMKVQAARRHDEPAPEPYRKRARCVIAIVLTQVLLLAF